MAGKYAKAAPSVTFGRSDAFNVLYIWRHGSRYRLTLPFS